jgi:hypothetical protein
VNAVASTARGLVLAVLSCWGSGPLEIRLEGGRFVVRGWSEAAHWPPERWKESFAVFVDTGDRAAPSLLGSYSVKEGALIFEPRFPLQPGLTYRAECRTHPPVVARFEIPRNANRPSTRVENIFPSANRLPENQLKLYLYFSAPMSRGELYRRVSLLDSHGKAVELPFLELEQELWDPSGKRVTLLFDPGRIKRDLVPNREVGPALKAGKHYTLQIDVNWPDAEGTPLAQGFQKEFVAVEADRTPPELKTWSVATPAAGTNTPLVVSFPEPMDRALLEHFIFVQEAGGKELSGTVAIEAEERRWHFTPQQPWEKGAYSLAVDTALEDLAGNRIGRPFDVDLFERVERRIRREIVTLPFQVR